MALLQKRPATTSSAPLYTVGASKTALVIGLGNPEKKYDGTRHNVGFAIVDFFAQTNSFPGWTVKKDLKCEVTVNTLGDTRVILCKPTTFMNLSGEATQAVQHFYRIYNPQTIAVYDELDIPFGQLRTRSGGSSAGHNGVKSLIQHLSEDFGRLRVGIGSEINQKADAADFVLSKFTKEEQEKLPLIYREASSLLSEFIFGTALAPETRSVL
jgi:PTH1 family peptidyl-tRNA hydrolase